MNLNDYKLELNYPCRWTYKVIGSIKEDLRQAVKDVVGDLDHTFSNNSKTGRYLSLKLELTVRDEAQRVGIYRALSRHRAIKIVL